MAEVKHCDEYLVEDNSNVFYTDCKGEEIFDHSLKGEFIFIDPSKPFSSNLTKVINPLHQVYVKPSFIKYFVKDVMHWVILLFSVTLGVISFNSGIPLMGGFMIGIGISLIMGNYIYWKKL